MLQNDDGVFGAEIRPIQPLHDLRKKPPFIGGIGEQYVKPLPPFCQQLHSPFRISGDHFPPILKPQQAKVISDGSNQAGIFLEEYGIAGPSAEGFESAIPASGEHIKETGAFNGTEDSEQ
jgi:hypothetical protein